MVSAIRSVSDFKKVFCYLQNEALKGNGDGMAYLGSIYSDGQYIARDSKKELNCWVNLYRKSNENYILGNFALIYRDFGEMRGVSYFLKKLMDAGSIDAPYCLAHFYNVNGRNNELVKNLLLLFLKRVECGSGYWDTEEHAEQSLESLERGDNRFECRAVCADWGKNEHGYLFDETQLDDLKIIHAKFARAIMHYEFFNYKRTIVILRELSSRYSYPLAMDLLGYMYCNGIGVNRNMNRSIAWYQKAINMGYAKSLLHLAEAYRTTVEFNKYHDVLQEAVCAGNMEAHVLLAEWYGVICEDRQVPRNLLNKVIYSDNASPILKYEAEKLIASLEGDNKELMSLKQLLEKSK